jgi:energy-coupling factor transport system substrate-specific component
MKASLLSIAIYLATLGSGLLVLLYPFFLPQMSRNGVGGMRSAELPLLMTLLLALCLLVLLYEVQGQTLIASGPPPATVIALLGVLVAINSALRFIETAVPGPGGFTPLFFLIILSGYVFGARFGFLMGALSMLVSALVTGGVGPWLPNQMFTAGWVGMSAALLRVLIPRCTISQGDARRLRQIVLLLAAFGFIWGFLYGGIMNLWQWPFMAGPQAQSWQAGQGFWAAVQHYAVFYLATSLVWDTIAALGNLLIILAFGAPALRALRRFQLRFSYQEAA